jgi:excinuclease ABC subunit C
MEEDGARYFGPFASARSIRQTLKVIKGLFPYRNCNKSITGDAPRACLEYSLGRCAGPCIGAVSRAEYAQIIRDVILFLEGKQDHVIRELRQKMRQASDDMEFEKAAHYRDQIEAMQSVIEGQKIAATARGEQDAVAFVQERDIAYVQVFFVRNNKLTGRESFVLQGTRHEKPRQIMTGFVKQFYASSPNIPPRILLQHPVEDLAIIREWLRGKRGAKVEIQVPRRGSKKQLVDTVAENAQRGLEQMKIKQLASPWALDEALSQIEEELHLKARPRRMEAYDISNIQGKAAVGSMVVFENGKPRPAHYRRFKIRTVTGANDYAMLQEVLQRRFHRVNGGSAAPDSWAILPDLILIDGGKGQLSAALSAMEKAGAGSVPVAGIAKENEEIFLPFRREPVVLPRSSPGLQLLQRLRDEAHRFAISYFTGVHGRESFGSLLDGIPGIGPRRKRNLLKRFGSVEEIRKAPLEELAATDGMTTSQAKKLKEYL